MLEPIAASTAPRARTLRARRGLAACLLAAGLLAATAAPAAAQKAALGTVPKPGPAPKPAPAPAPAPTPTINPWWVDANARGLAGRGAGASARGTLNAAARTGDDGIVVLRGFIPHGLAAKGLLLGDGRTWSAAPAENARSRFVLTWNTATGAYAFQVLPTSLRNGASVRALPVRIRPIAQVDIGDDLRPQLANDIGVVALGGGGLRVRAAAVNSVTNVPGAAWSVDVDLTIRPRRSGVPGSGYRIDTIGNGYPAIEALYYPRRAARATAESLYQRRIDPGVLRSPAGRFPDTGGGVAARNDVSWWSCGSLAVRTPGSVCTMTEAVPALRSAFVLAADRTRRTYRTSANQAPLSPIF